MANMTEKQMREQLDAAKAYRLEQVRRLDASIAELKAGIQGTQAQLERWKTMSPAEVLDEMAQERRREAARQEAEELRLEMESRHASAMREVLDGRKGLITPQAKARDTGFALAGAVLGGVLVPCVLKALFDVGAPGWLLTAGGFGAAAGLLGGYAWFGANFVVDESLEGLAAGRSMSRARETLRQTYFKSGNN